MNTLSTRWYIRIGFWLAVILTALALSGCTNPAATADKLDAQTQGQTKIIATAVDQGQQHIAAADDQVLFADDDIEQAIAGAMVSAPQILPKLEDAHQRLNGPTTKPATQPSAHVELQAAAKSLAPVAPAVAKVQAISHQQAAVTHTAVTNLKVERSKFFSYKQRMIGYILLALLPLIGIIVFAVKVAGGRAILQVLGDAVGAVGQALLAAAKFIGKGFIHVVTLGGSALADAVNKKYEQKSATNPADATTATSPPIQTETKK